MKPRDKDRIGNRSPAHIKKPYIKNAQTSMGVYMARRKKAKRTSVSKAWSRTRSKK